MKQKIKVEAVIHASLETIWSAWNNPAHIMYWAHASDDWECPYATNDLEVGGKFLTRMSAKDGSVSFDFEGVYTELVPMRRISYVISDGRTVTVDFEMIHENEYRVSETFELEDMHTEEQQRGGWQAILNNFKEYTESL